MECLSWQQSRDGTGVAEHSIEDEFDAASGRLDRALSRLDASVRSLNGRMRGQARLEADVQRLNAERGRLSGELDKASVKAKRLDESAHDVSRRLVDAMEQVRAVLAK